MKGILEICVDSAASAIAAQDGGADRIELCSALAIGGISPSPALFRQVKENTALEVRVLLRPRAGDFCYDEYEFRQLREEVEMFRKLGADGVVIGILRSDGTLNVEQMKELVRLAGTMKVTMHRLSMYAAIRWRQWKRVYSWELTRFLQAGRRALLWKGGNFWQN